MKRYVSMSPIGCLCLVLCSCIVLITMNNSCITGGGGLWHRQHVISIHIHHYATPIVKELI